MVLFDPVPVEGQAGQGAVEPASQRLLQAKVELVDTQGEWAVVRSAEYPTIPILVPVTWIASSSNNPSLNTITPL